jgi:hypothetical protein
MTVCAFCHTPNCDWHEGWEPTPRASNLEFLNALVARLAGIALAYPETTNGACDDCGHEGQRRHLGAFAVCFTCARHRAKAQHLIEQETT